MDRIETYPMGLDEAAESKANEASSSSDGSFRRWTETLPAALPDAPMRAPARKARGLALFAAVIGLLGLIAYALREIFRR
jgi:hypothetical protein